MIFPRGKDLYCLLLLSIPLFFFSSFYDGQTNRVEKDNRHIRDRERDDLFLSAPFFITSLFSSFCDKQGHADRQTQTQTEWRIER